MAKSEKQMALDRAKRATRGFLDAAERRDDAIREAAAVASLREVAEATGLSKPRIGQIVRDSA